MGSTGSSTSGVDAPRTGWDRRAEGTGMRIRSRLRREDGAAAVEFALIVGVLAMLLFGMLQFGLAFFQLQNLRAAVREGARVGAVGGSVSQVKQRVSDNSDGLLPANSAAVAVQSTTNGSTWVNAVTRACPTPQTQTVQSATRVQIDLSSSSLPQALQNIFTVDIPFLPPVSLRGSTISSEFRCEGV
jgi:Flp pilus assembly protein TadG